MRKFIGTFLLESRYAATVLPAVLVLIPAVFFMITGSYDPETLPWYFESKRAFQGQVLMYTILPAYMGLCLIFGLRRSIELAQQIDATNGTLLVSSILAIPYRWVAFFTFAGMLFAVFFNIPGYGLNFFETDLVEQSIIIGQLGIWSMITGLLSVRFYIALQFQRVSDDVDIDILQPVALQPFAKLGLIDVLTIAGAMVISTAQSLDFAFRPDNYVNAIIIALPSVLYLAIYPMWRIHKRMKAEKEMQLIAINQLIAEAPRELDDSLIRNLEVLLQRRERILHAAAWPIDISIVQRFLFYIIIPPLAWVGAALVELMIDGFVSGH